MNISRHHVDEEDFLNYLSDQSKNSDMDYICQGWQSPKSKKSKKKKSKKQVVVVSRTSSRVLRDGIHIAAKMAHTTKNRNSNSGTTCSDNPFTVLNSAKTTDLEKVVLDLDLDIGDVEEQIDIFRVEELARAAIAKANYKVFLAKQKGREDPLSEPVLKKFSHGGC